jgi:hypothetical protein
VAAEIIVETLLATIAARKAELDQLRIRAPAGTANFDRSALVKGRLAAAFLSAFIWSFEQVTRIATLRSIYRHLAQYMQWAFPSTQGNRVNIADAGFRPRVMAIG